MLTSKHSEYWTLPFTNRWCLPYRGVENCFVIARQGSDEESELLSVTGIIEYSKNAKFSYGDNLKESYGELRT